MGTPPKNSLKRSLFMVAEVTMSFRSLRSFSSFFMMPNSTSVFSDRSCASSMMTTLYCDSRRSPIVSRSRMPSVMYLMRVASLVTSSKRIEYPTSSPILQPCSSATRFATLEAATRRGCVHPISPSRP